MSARWIMNRPGPEENRKAAGIAFGVGAAIGAVAFYFVRMLVSRERIERVPPTRKGTGVERRREGEEGEGR